MAVVLANGFADACLPAFFTLNQAWRVLVPLFRRELGDLLDFFNGSNCEFYDFIGSFNVWSIDNERGMKLVAVGFGKEVPFLDITVFEHTGQWHSKVFYKQSEVYAYLHPTLVTFPRYTKTYHKWWQVE